MIINMTGGTGVGKLFAAISVQYPEGSAVTCTDGRKTLKAKTTTGLWLFAIPYSGSWTVTATDGKETASKTVEIAAEGQCAQIELEYRDYVIHDGILKGNYQIATTTATYEVVDGCLVFKSTKASSGNGNIKINENGQDIDLTNRSMLYFDTEATSPRSGTDDYVTWGVSGLSTVKKNLGVNNPVTRQIVSIDLSKVSTGQIALFISDIPATVELKIYDVWFD